MAINFSLILPSRGRLQLLRNLLQSVVKTTSYVDKIDAWIAFDWDDQESIKAIPELTRDYTWCHFLVTDRQTNVSAGYFNRLCWLGEGKYIQVLNDDCEFLTNAWDEIALSVLDNAFSDNILYARCQEDLNTGYGCFPIISRKALNVVGWIFHPEFTSWGADIMLHDMYLRLGRVVLLPYQIAHFSHHNPAHSTHYRKRDQTNIDFGNRARYNWHCAGGEANRVNNLISELAKSQVLQV